MTPKERAAVKLALEALELHLNGCGVAIATRIAYDALRGALDHSGEANEMVAEQAEQERKYGELAGTHNWTPPNYTDEQWQKLDQEYQDHVAEQESVVKYPGCDYCNDELFCGRKCKRCGKVFIEDEDFVQSEVKSLRQQVAALKAVVDAWNNVEQEPVAEVVLRSHKVGFGRTEERKDIVFLADVEVGTKLYAAPVRTKDMTDDEIHNLVKQVRFDGMTDKTFQFARAVIAADREKNRG